MTDLIRLATELERSGGQHRFIALVQAASLVLLRFEHGESVTVRGERWPLPAVEGAPDADVAVGGSSSAPDIAGALASLGDALVNECAKRDASCAQSAFGRGRARDLADEEASVSRALDAMRTIASRYQVALWNLALQEAAERNATPLADCQDEPRITHAPDSPIPDLVREPARRCVPRYPNPEDDGA